MAAVGRSGAAGRDRLATRAPDVTRPAVVRRGLRDPVDVACRHRVSRRTRKAPRSTAGAAAAAGGAQLAAAREAAGAGGAAGTSPRSVAGGATCPGARALQPP